MQPIDYKHNEFLRQQRINALSHFRIEKIGTWVGQSLVRVNGEEITVMQLNDELSRAKVQAEQLEQAKKQLLESMIDLQLMVAEAQQSKPVNVFSLRVTALCLLPTILATW